MAEPTPLRPGPAAPALVPAQALGPQPIRKVKRGKMPAELWAAVGEEFRILRTRVTTKLDTRHKLIQVTSALPQEGKSTVATMLARSFAQMEWRTLLIDCDLRQPSLHGLFGVDRAPGMIDLLLGRSREDEAIAFTDNTHLDLLTAGSQVAGPAEALQSAATPALLKGFAASYDYVVVDSPPLTSITDAHLLSGYVDGILFVVRGLVSPRDLVKSARDQLQDRPVLGVVLNGISTPKKYGYYY